MPKVSFLKFTITPFSILTNYIFSLFMITQALSSEGHKELGPEYSTELFYRFARLAYVHYTTMHKIQTEHNIDVKALDVVPKMEVNLESALASVKRAYRYNILERGLHVGIPLGLWDTPAYGGIRGDADFGNRMLCKLIQDIYVEQQEISEGVRLPPANSDPFVQAYILFDAAHMPKMPKDFGCLPGLVRFSTSTYKETFDKEEHEAERHRQSLRAQAEAQASRHHDEGSGSGECNPS